MGLHTEGPATKELGKVSEPSMQAPTKPIWPSSRGAVLGKALQKGYRSLRLPASHRLGVPVQALRSQTVPQRLRRRLQNERTQRNIGSDVEKT